MATPSSSATTPSPPILPMLPQSTIVNRSFIAQDVQQPIKSTTDFLARAELSTVTRALRTRLSYASFKATNNMSHVSLGDLEAQSSPAPTTSTTVTTTPTRSNKRKAAGGNHYGTPSNASTSNASVILDRRGSMAPPGAGPSASGSPGYRKHASAGSSTVTDAVTFLRQQSASKNLYTSILIPPPSKQARTIHNASDPPLPSAAGGAGAHHQHRHVHAASDAGNSTDPFIVNSETSHKAMGGSGSGRSARSIAEGTRSQARSRAQPSGGKKAKSTSSSGGAKSAAKRSGGKKGKEKEKPSSSASARNRQVDRDGDVDMKAAATTLASLLMHNRPTGSVASPRSSVSSESGSQQYQQQSFAQSLARTMNAPGALGPGDASQDSSSSLLAPAPSDLRRTTPSPNAEMSNLTPRQALPSGTAANKDTEAADLMLFLATSPSPVRPSNARERDAKDGAAFRILSGGKAGSSSLRDRGRVLFSEDGATESSVTLKRPLRDASFASSVSSIGGEMRGDSPRKARTSTVPIDRTGSGIGSAPMSRQSSTASNASTIPTPSTFLGLSPQPSQQQLLPPPPSPGLKVRSVPGPSPLAERERDRERERELRDRDRDREMAERAAHLLAPPSHTHASASSSSTSTNNMNLATPGGPTGISSPVSRSVNSTPFNFGEFLHSSPAVPGGPATHIASPAGPPAPLKGGMRADVGRKLFEGEQVRAGQHQHMYPEPAGSGYPSRSGPMHESYPHSHPYREGGASQYDRYGRPIAGAGGPGSGPAPGAPTGAGVAKSGLGAGIDLMQG